MAETSALITLEEAVSRYLFKTKKGTEDYSLYLEHAAQLLQSFSTYDSQEARSEKVAVSALGIIEMPVDLIKVKDVCVAKSGEWWSMTLRPEMVNTTTVVLGAETHDSTFGEGVALLDNRTSGYGAKGGVNEYYYSIDYKARRIFCDGIISDTVLLRYTSSGIQASATTYMPVLLIDVLDKYLRYVECFWNDKLMRVEQIRKDDYDKERRKVRNLLNGLSSNQWKDIFWGSFAQAPKR